eukprot:s683_g8.t1
MNDINKQLFSTQQFAAVRVVATTPRIEICAPAVFQGWTCLDTALQKRELVPILFSSSWSSFMQCFQKHSDH